VDAHLCRVAFSVAEAWHCKGDFGMPGTKKSGRRRMPSILRRLEGRRSHHRIPDDPTPIGQPEFPPYLRDVHRELWDTTLRSMPAGVFCASDQAMLEAFVVAWECLRATTVMIVRTGLLVQSPSGAVRNPLLPVRARALSEIRSLGSELGMSPAARAKLLAPKEAEDDPLRLLLGEDNVSDADRWSTRPVRRH
jgi:P27 family predicted phage terminase small subunit